MKPVEVDNITSDCGRVQNQPRCVHGACPSCAYGGQRFLTMYEDGRCIHCGNWLGRHRVSASSCGCYEDNMAIANERHERDFPTKHYRAGGGDAGLLAKIMAAQLSVEKRIANITKGSTHEEEL